MFFLLYTPDAFYIDTCIDNSNPWQRYLVQSAAIQGALAYRICHAIVTLTVDLHFTYGQK